MLFASHRLASLGLLVVLLLSACSSQPTPPAATPTALQPSAATTTSATPSAAATPAAAGDALTGAAVLTGELSFTADYLLDLYTDQAVALVDLHGFVLRDQLWEIPVDGQVLGPMNFNRKAGTATYELHLPLRPAATPSDVDNDGVNDPAVQIFNVAWSPNVIGGVFSEGDDRSYGWYSGMSSTIHDPNTQDEVSGGKLVVWAPDTKQQFPTGFGPDGLLFTADDPVGPLAQGYTVVDLDQKPFALLRAAEQDVRLYEPKDIEAKDYTKLPYDEALRKLIADARSTYAFDGIAGKEPDWDALLRELEPRAAKAQAAHDPQAFYRVLQDFTAAFKDGHVGLSAPPELYKQLFANDTDGGYGFAVRELDDGRFLVVFVLEDGPAAKAGLRVGAELTAFNGKPVGEAVAAVPLVWVTSSSDVGRRYQQARYLLRAPVDTKASVSFTNPGEQSKTVELTTVAERASFSATSVYRGAPEALLPIEFKILESGVGYIYIGSYSDDMSLTWRLFERALATFEQAQVPGIIIDLRWNGGGIPLGLAGYFTDKEIILGQPEKRDTARGTFVKDGPADRVRPLEPQYSFGKIAVLVGMGCASACEQEAYGFSQLANAVVVGEYPSAGIFASVVPDGYRLPDGMTLQLSMRRFTNPDGSLFLEGKGVVPTVDVPIDEKTLQATTDVELEAAQAAILKK